MSQYRVKIFFDNVATRYADSAIFTDLSFIKELDKSRIRYRSQGSIQFSGQDYDDLRFDFFNGFQERLNIEIEEYTTTWVKLFDGYVDLYTNYDDDKRICNLTVTITDNYTDIDDLFDLEFTHIGNQQVTDSGFANTYENGINYKALCNYILSKLENDNVYVKNIDIIINYLTSPTLPQLYMLPAYESTKVHGTSDKTTLNTTLGKLFRLFENELFQLTWNIYEVNSLRVIEFIEGDSINDDYSSNAGINLFNYFNKNFIRNRIDIQANNGNINRYLNLNSLGQTIDFDQQTIEFIGINGSKKNESGIQNFVSDIEDSETNPDNYNSDAYFFLDCTSGLTDPSPDGSPTLNNFGVDFINKNFTDYANDPLDATPNFITLNPDDTISNNEIRLRNTSDTGDQGLITKWVWDNNAAANTQIHFIIEKLFIYSGGTNCVIKIEQDDIVGGVPSGNVTTYKSFNLLDTNFIYERMIVGSSIKAYRLNFDFETATDVALLGIISLGQNINQIRESIGQISGSTLKNAIFSNANIAENFIKEGSSSTAIINGNQKSIDRKNNAEIKNIQIPVRPDFDGLDFEQLANVNGADLFEVRGQQRKLDGTFDVLEGRYIFDDTAKKLTFKVTDDVGNGILANIEVSGGGLPVNLNITTDHFGEGSLRLPPTTYNYSVSGDNFDTVNDSVVIYTNDVTELVKIERNDVSYLKISDTDFLKISDDEFLNI